MTTMTCISIVGRTLLLILTLAVGIAAGSQDAAACSDTAERYPMLIGSGYEGEPCEPADAPCTDIAERFPVLIGSGYDVELCRLATSNTTVAQSPNQDWHETMLDGSGYERDANESAPAGQDCS